jgi:hypothetical protein
LKKDNNFTTGKVYLQVIENEREGKYLGKTVQVVPHITDEIKRRIHIASENCDLLIGEIGGNLEAIAARWIKENGTKPVVGFIAGETAPAGRTMGHAGAIVGGDDDTAEAKKRIMRECGIHVVDSPAVIGKTMADVINK